VNPNYEELNLEAQKAAEKSHYKVYTHLTSMRTTPTFQKGDCHVAAVSDNVLAFTRCLFQKHILYDFTQYCYDSEVKETRTALGPTQPHIQWVPGALFLGCEADDSPAASAEVKECVELYLHSPNTPSWRGAH
jgi:hypothetical protein